VSERNIPVGGRPSSIEIFAIGHSTRPIEKFIKLLQAHAIKTVADIRTVPRSRTNPQFNQENLARDLPQAGIRSVHLKDLGGLRRPLKDSQNTGWENTSFRGYADYDAPSHQMVVERVGVMARQCNPKNLKTLLTH
jgi:uncharacterized protein (DUF488 family)